MVDDIILKTILILFFSVYLFQMVAQFVYHYEDEDDEDDDEDDDHSNNDDCNDRKVVTVAYEDKFLTKMRDAKRLKDGLLKDGLKDPLDLTYLKNNFVMEYTPVGNVLMYYNVVKECFDYYSDSTIPYRYLEVVSRKYVLMNNCVSIYFDMEEELAQCEVKNKNRQKEIEKEKEKDRIDWEEKTNKQEEEKDLKDSKKSVFAKFKSYNKEGGTGHVSTAPPPKNNISQVNVKTNNSENICLKEHANRYSHQGKILNFSMLQKVDRTKVDKKFAMSYAEFKRLKNMEGIYDKENKEE